MAIPPILPKKVNPNEHYPKPAPKVPSFKPSLKDIPENQAVSFSERVSAKPAGRTLPPVLDPIEESPENQ